MKKILVTLLIATATTGAFAQDSSRTGRKHARPEYVRPDLKLDEQQTEKVKTINKEFMTSAKAVQKNDALTKTEKRAKMAEIDKKRSEQFKSVMNAEQYSKWEDSRKAGRTKMEGIKDKQHRKMAHGKGKHREQMQQELGLNDEQSKQLKSIHGEFRDKAMALRNNKELSDTDRKAQVKKLRDERDGKLKATLSSEQYEKLRQHGKKQHHPKGVPAEKEAASTNN